MARAVFTPFAVPKRNTSENGTLNAHAPVGSVYAWPPSGGEPHDALSKTAKALFHERPHRSSYAVSPSAQRIRSFKNEQSNLTKLTPDGR